MAPRRVLTDSPFDTLEKTFDLLVTGPNPLALDGTVVRRTTGQGDPARRAEGDAPAPLHVLRRRATRWSTSSSPVPVPVAAPGPSASPGCSCPGSVGPSGRSCSPVRARPPTSRPRPSPRSWPPWPAASRAERASRPGCAGWPASAPTGCCKPRWPSAPGRAQIRSPPPRADRGDTPTSCWSGPCGPGSSARPDAELIGATRIGDVELAEVANALGISYKACHQRRRRAESALVEWLTSDRYSPFEFVEKGPENPCSSNGGRPRQGRSMDRRPDKRRSTPTPRR